MFNAQAFERQQFADEDVGLCYGEVLARAAVGTRTKPDQGTIRSLIQFAVRTVLFGTRADSLRIRIDIIYMEFDLRIHGNVS